MKPRLVQTISPDWFDELIAKYVKVARQHEQAAQDGEAQFIREAVEFWRDNTNSKQVHDRCNSWLGRRS